MYDEKADFIRHEDETRAFFKTLAACSYEPSHDHTVLDLGGGQGMHVGALTQRFGKVWCLDVINYSTLYGGEFIKLLIEKYARNGVPLAADRVAFVQGDAMNLLFKDGFFDLCLSINSFEHIPDPSRALAEIIRVLRPGGWAYISFDPVWTCATGSHFFHRVPEPWAHLVYPEEEFVARMRANGADEGEASEFRHAMNRWRLPAFQEMFDDARALGLIEIAKTSVWSGLQDSAHEEHEHLRTLLKRGFTTEELYVRGAMYALRKTPPRPS